MLRKKGLLATDAKRRVRWTLLALLWVWAGCVFLVIDLFLNVEEFDGVRPRARMYRAMRHVAHEMVGERSRDPEFESVAPVAVGGVTARAGGPEGFQTLVYADGAKAEEGEWRAGRREGDWVFYHPDGSVAARERYEAGGPAGETVRYHQNGSRAERGIYAEGKREGDWVSWHGNGSRAVEESYANGEREGSYRAWHPDGSPAAAGEFVGGRQRGQWVEYDPEGDRTREGQFVAGQMQGLWRHWDGCGKVLSEEVWEAGKKIREVSYEREAHPLDAQSFAARAPRAHAARALADGAEGGS